MTVSQTAFQAGLLDADIPAPAGLHDDANRPAGKRYDVYRNNVAVSLADALEVAFPVVKKLVGDAFFRAMAAVYLRKHPPTSPLMMFYGDMMPKFLMRFTPAQQLAYLPDVARLELALRHAYHAADAVAINRDTLTALPPDRMMGARFRFAPAVQLMRSPYPIHGIYRFNTLADAPKPVMQAENVLISRPAFDTMLDPLSPAAANLIDGLMAGDTLAVAMSKAGTDLNLGAVLGTLLTQAAITEIY